MPKIKLITLLLFGACATPEQVETRTACHSDNIVYLLVDNRYWLSTGKFCYPKEEIK